MIVGGGNVGAGLAAKLEKDYNVKLIERNQQRAAELAEQLHDTIVFYGDASDQELLAEEHVEQVDVFIAITNDDEANIMSAMLAKRMGAKKVMVLIQRRAYVDLVQGSVIDIAISPTGDHLRPVSTCAKRISSAFHRCAAAWQKRSKRLPTVMKARPKWSAASSKTSSCHQVPPSVRSCVATT